MKKMIVALIIGFMAGWVVDNWRHESDALGDIKSMIALQQKSQALTQQHGRLLEEILMQKRINDDQFDQTLAKIIHKNSDNMCFDADFVELFNNKVDRSRAILSGESTD